MNIDVFDEWNIVKKATSLKNFSVGFKNRDIFYIKMGQNIGYEQNGKGDHFVRPVIVLKRFNDKMFFGIPLSTKIKKGYFYHTFEFVKQNKVVQNNALLSQMRLFSSNRLLNKIGVINKDDFKTIKEKLVKLIN